MMSMVTGADEVTPAWLAEALALDTAAVVSVRAEETVTMLSHCVRLRVEYASRASQALPGRLFLKFSRATPDLKMSVGAREVAFYRDVAPKMSAPPVPACFGAEYFGECDHFQLLLQDLSETHVAGFASQIPPSEREWGQIVAAIARYQAAWWDHPELGKRVGTRPDMASIHTFCLWAHGIHDEFRDFLGDRISPNTADLYERTLAGLEPALASRLLEGKHLTLFHGDSHSGNYLYPIDGDVACIVDWQGWGVETGVLDLVALMALYWSPERRGRLEQASLESYHRQLLKHGVPGAYTWDRCRNDYRLAILKALFFPLAHWKAGLSSDIWWNSFERISAAARDLDCLELLG